MAALVPFMENVATNPVLQSLAFSAIGSIFDRIVGAARCRSRSRSRSWARSQTVDDLPSTMRFGDTFGSAQSKREETVFDSFQTKNMCTVDI